MKLTITLSNRHTPQGWNETFILPHVTTPNAAAEFADEYRRKYNAACPENANALCEIVSLALDVVTAQDAFELGKKSYRANHYAPNPFPPGELRQAWDKGYRVNF